MKVGGVIRSPVVKGLVGPHRAVPELIPQPNYAVLGYLPKVKYPAVPIPKTAAEIEGIRVACSLAREVLETIAPLAAQPGITTDEIDEVAHREITRRGAYPSPLLYEGFPKSICTSVNEVVCHGIPDSRKLADGDIVNLDVTVFYNGFHGDLSETYPCGRVDPEGLRLIAATRDGLHAAIAACRPRQPLTVIGDAIGDVVEPQGFFVCSDVLGHGIGRTFHEPPSIFHGRVPEGFSYPGTLLEGLVFTIEPVVLERPAPIRTWDDGWTVVTEGLVRAAQFEHTVVVTPSGLEVLTAREGLFKNGVYTHPRLPV